MSIDIPEKLALEFYKQVDNDTSRMLDIMTETIVAMHKRAEELKGTSLRDKDNVFYHVHVALRSYVNILLEKELLLRLKVLEKLRGDNVANSKRLP